MDNRNSRATFKAISFEIHELQTIVECQSARLPDALNIPLHYSNIATDCTKPTKIPVCRISRIICSDRHLWYFKIVQTDFIAFEIYLWFPWIFNIPIHYVCQCYKRSKMCCLANFKQCVYFLIVHVYCQFCRVIKQHKQTLVLMNNFSSGSGLL